MDRIEKDENNKRSIWNFYKAKEIKRKTKDINFRHYRIKNVMIIEDNIPLFQCLKRKYQYLFEFMGVASLKGFNNDKSLNNFI